MRRCCSSGGGVRHKLAIQMRVQTLLLLTTLMTVLVAVVVSVGKVAQTGDAASRQNACGETEDDCGQVGCGLSSKANHEVKGN